MTKYRTWIICAAVLLAFAVQEAALAQSILPSSEYRKLVRAKLWEGLMNTGLQGADHDGGRRGGSPCLAYPGRGGSEAPGAYGGRAWPGSNQWVQDYLNETRTGRSQATFILTQPDPKEYTPKFAKTYNASFTALKTSVDIVPVRYPVETMPEGLAKVGNDTRHPVTGGTLASWWPGQPPLGSDKVLEIHNWQFNTYMKPEHKRFGELLGIAHWTTETGVTGTKKIYQWSFRDYDDLIIVENTFENTGDSNGDGKPDLNGGKGLTLNNTYFSFMNYLWPTSGGTANKDVPLYRGYGAWLLRGGGFFGPTMADDWYRYTEAPDYLTAEPNYASLPEAKGLKMSYAFDGDHPLTSWEDTGDPHVVEVQCCWGRINSQVRGEIMAGQYIGFLPIDYNPTDGFANDTGTYVAPKVKDQPFAVPWFTYGPGTPEEPDIDRNTEDEIFQALTTVHQAGKRPSALSRYLSERTPIPVDPKAPLPVPNSPYRGAETATQPIGPNWYISAHTYGPYDLKLGDKVKIVTAFVAGMPAEENIWGWQKDAANNQKDLLAGKAAKMLVKHAKAAQDLYRFNYDVPVPPPDPLISIANTPAANAQVSWSADAENAEDPDYVGTPEAKDVAGYRVYRSNFHVDDWGKPLADIKKGDPQYYNASTKTYTFVDKESLAGFEYNYAVTTYDTGHSNFKGRGAVPSLESGLAAAEQILRYAYKPYSPAVASSAETNALQKQVFVVPNPFLADGRHAYEGSDKIRFVNLPVKANIKIFSVSGDLMAEFNHNANLGEEEFFQVTREVSGQLSAGVYFFVVKSQTPESMGKIQRGTFVVVGGTQQ